MIPTAICIITLLNGWEGGAEVMKVEYYKGRKIVIDQNQEKGYHLIPSISSVFQITKENLFLRGLEIDYKTFREDDFGLIEFDDDSDIVEVKADGVRCPRVTNAFSFVIKGKEKILLEVIREKTYRYVLTFRDPYPDTTKGIAFANEKVYFTLFGAVKRTLYSLKCRNEETGEESELPLFKEDFPPNTYWFIMPSFDISLSLMDK